VLGKEKSLKVKVRVTLTPRGGTAASRTVSIVLKSKRKR
jgi:hypothetical protein